MYSKGVLVAVCVMCLSSFGVCNSASKSGVSFELNYGLNYAEMNRSDEEGTVWNLSNTVGLDVYYRKKINTSWAIDAGFSASVDLSDNENTKQEEDESLVGWQIGYGNGNYLGSYGSVFVRPLYFVSERKAYFVSIGQYQSTLKGNSSGDQKISKTVYTVGYGIGVIFFGGEKNDKHKTYLIAEYKYLEYPGLPELEETNYPLKVSQFSVGAGMTW